MHFNRSSHGAGLCLMHHYRAGIASQYTKRSRARVTIGGQCVLLPNSLKIKLFNFFSRKPKLLYKSHLSRHTSEPMKKMVIIIETRPQSSKNAPKWIKIGKIHDIGKSTLVFGFQ